MIDEHDYRDGSEEPPPDEHDHDECCTLPQGCEGGCGQPGGCADRRALITVPPPGWPHLPYQPRRSPADTVTGEFTRVMQDVLANLRDQLHRTHSPDELEAEIAGHCAEAAANQLRELLDGLIAYRDVNTVS